MSIGQKAYKMKKRAALGIINETMVLFSGKIMIVALSKADTVMMQNIEYKTLDELRLAKNEFAVRGFEVFSTRDV